MPPDTPVKTAAPEASPPCPICGKPAAPEVRPFCSKRCANVDLQRWLSGRYAVPTDEAPGSDEEAGQA